VLFWTGVVADFVSSAYLFCPPKSDLKVILFIIYAVSLLVETGFMVVALGMMRRMIG